MRERRKYRSVGGMIDQHAQVVDDAEDALAFFRGRGFDVRIEDRDLHAECMARGDPGRASNFVERRRYYCVDLLRDGVVIAAHYAHGDTPDDAMNAARRRFGSEQG